MALSTRVPKLLNFRKSFDSVLSARKRFKCFVECKHFK